MAERRCALLLLGLVLASGLTAAPLSSEGRWDWGLGTFTLTLKTTLPPDRDLTPPKRRYLAERDTERYVQQEFVRRVAELPASSGQTLGERMAADPALEAAVAQLGTRLRFVSSRVDEAYTTLEMAWTTGLWNDLSPLLGVPEQVNPLPERLVWTPSRDFSGLVIFAMGDLQWLGTGLSARWVPSLRFRLLNPRGEVVFEPSMSQPDFSQRWGQAATSLGKFNEESYRDRIGYDPLRIVARGVWGARPGDLVLAAADWDRLLAREANRRLLAEGRVLILYGPFPDYVSRPNPDSAIDLEKPPVEVVPEPPAPAAPAKKPSGGE